MTKDELTDPKVEVDAKSEVDSQIPGTPPWPFQDSLEFGGGRKPLTGQGITDKETLKQLVLTTFDQICDEFGGPQQWLADKFGGPEAAKLFRTDLLKQFPMMASVDYVQPALLGKREKVFVHISMLSFDADRSSKGLPYRHTCRELLEEYLCSGFLTESQPLLLWATQEDKALPQCDFVVRYVKGMARSCTLLATISILNDLHICALTHFPALAQSLMLIHCNYEMHADLASVAIANAHHSNRGAIRAPHDLMTWVTKLRLLETGCSIGPTAILERFNSTATTKRKVVGNRRVSALALLNKSCHAGCDRMIQLLSHVGLKAVWWSEDSFCNKKLLPGFTPRTNRNAWNAALSVTEESFLNWVERLNRQQMDKKPAARRSLDKSLLEEHAQLTSFWCWAVTDAAANALDEKALKELHEKFLNGDVALSLDLQTLLHERKNDISWNDVRLGAFNLPGFSFELNQVFAGVIS